MRKLASIVTVATCDPIPETDRLSVTTMKENGWLVVTGRDEYKPGDLAVYFEIDSALPADDERYGFLRDRCLRKFTSKSGTVLKEVIRIKTIRLRGFYSQGLLIPLSKFPELTDNIVHYDNGDRYLVHDNGSDLRPVELSGLDVTNILHVEHYDEIKAALAPECGCPSIPDDARMSDFPTLACPKTDETRIQNLKHFFETMKGHKFEITEKRDGTSVTMLYSPRMDSEHPFAVCSRNMRLKPCTDKGIVPLPWKVCNELSAERKISDYCRDHNRELAFQGELNGVGIQANPDVLPFVIWQVFKVFDCVAHEYLLPSEARDLCKEIGLEYVPVIEAECDVFNRFHTLDELLAFAEGKTDRGNEREGIVFKSCDYPYVSFKAVSNKYLLKHGD